jgi:hypothetical protein
MPVLVRTNIPLEHMLLAIQVDLTSNRDLHAHQSFRQGTSCFSFQKERKETLVTNVCIGPSWHGMARHGVSDELDAGGVV